MPHPKRKLSKSRRDKRRTHQGDTAATIVTCPNCSAPKLYHTICGACGFYRGKQFIEKETV